MSPRKRPGRVVSRVMWTALGAWALALGVFAVVRGSRSLPRPGDTVLRAELAGRAVRGGELALLPRDSAVAVLAATSECAACRGGLPAYHALAERLRDEGVALRVIVGSDSLAAHQFARLLPDPAAVVWDPGQRLFRAVGLRTVPALVLVGSDGRLVRRWAPLPGTPRAVAEVAQAARGTRAGTHGGGARAVRRTEAEAAGK